MTRKGNAEKKDRPCPSMGFIPSFVGAGCSIRPAMHEIAASAGQYKRRLPLAEKSGKVLE